jgi:hypothetical protein
MGVNWDSGLLYWKDYVPSASERYSLSHLHPFVRQMELTATNKHPARIVQLHVSFGLHTFTRSVEGCDRGHELYHDNREVRTFCPVRHARSLELPGIVRTLEFVAANSREAQAVESITSPSRRQAGISMRPSSTCAD